MQNLGSQSVGPESVRSAVQNWCPETVGSQPVDRPSEDTPTSPVTDSRIGDSKISDPSILGRVSWQSHAYFCCCCILKQQCTCIVHLVTCSLAPTRFRRVIMGHKLTNRLYDKDVTRTLLIFINYNQIFTKYAKNKQIHVETFQDCHFLEIKKSNTNECKSYKSDGNLRNWQNERLNALWPDISSAKWQMCQ
jgi:hypothetical protein